MPVVDVDLGQGGRIAAEVAHTDQQRQTGLMYRESMEEDAGMLFVFDAPRGGGFWMKNTLIPLSIAFLSRDCDAFTVRAVLDMEPCTDDPCPVYDPGVSYEAALEVNKGRFGDAVTVGHVLTVDAALPAPA